MKRLLWCKNMSSVFFTLEEAKPKNKLHWTRENNTFLRNKKRVEIFYTQNLVYIMFA